MTHSHVAQFFALKQPKLRAYIRSMVFNPSDVDDILQDVAMIATKNADRYQNDRPFDAWVFGIAKNRVLKYFEKTGHGKLQFSSDLVDTMARECVASTHATDGLDDLRVCLEQLPDEKRQLLLRRHQPGATARELAQEIGYTDTRMSRMLNTLYQTLVKCISSQHDAVTHG